MSAWNLERFLIERYVEGRLPLPGPLVQAILNVVLELYYRFAPTMEVLPEPWSGAVGPIAERSDDLMRIHYDKPAVLFENFLGQSMKYSMALWESGARDLDDAQQAMLADLCDKVQIRDGDSILDIGCGFGSFAAYALRRFPSAKVVGITLSNVQYRYITAKQSQPGHALHDDRFRVIKEDFAKCRFGRQFDRIVSIGVFEHVSNLRLALEKIASFLRPEGSVLLHYIVYQRIIKAMANIHQDGFFGRYIFPGGRFWPFNELFRYQEHLRIERSWFLNGNNYRRTLEAWHANFWRNIAAIRAHPELDERFVRIWDFYLRFCIAIFGGMKGANVGNGQYLLRHATTPA
jgi:cyclopropane-fatty-acyl-phospholipid synthase